MLPFTWYILGLQEIGSTDSSGAQRLCFSPCSAPGAAQTWEVRHAACMYMQQHA